MSRIDAALRRASGLEATPPPNQGREDVFVSVWDGMGPEASPERTPEPPQAAARPADGAHILVKSATATPPALSGRWQERIASYGECDPALLEQYRRLASTLNNTQAASGIKLLLVTSAHPGEGKTLTALNLALVLSQSYGRNVLLIDADLRRPSIGEVVDVTGSVGLSAALRAQNDQKLGVISLSPNLTVLPAGPADPDPLSGLTSPRMRRILDEAVSRFDWVIVDGPPVGPLADASTLSHMTEGTLLVVRAAETAHAAVAQAVESVGRDRILGVVLNGVEPTGMDRYTPYYQQGAGERA